MTIKVRQICIIMFIYTVVTRLLLYPTMLGEYSSRDLLFAALPDFLIQGIVIWSVSYLCSRTEKTLPELVKDTVGVVGSRIVFGFFAAFFLLATIIPLFEQKLYVHAIFYDTVPSLAVFLPIFFFSVYAGTRNFKNIGRCADICLPIFIISMILIIAMSLSEVDFSNLLPIAKTPARDIFSGSLKTAYRFTEPAYLLMFVGRFRYKRGDAAKITLSYVAGGLLVLFFLAVFYGIYGDLTPSRQFAISKVSLYFSAIDIVGRIDLLVLYMLEIVMLFALVLNVQFAVYCLVECTGWKNVEVLSLCVNGALAAILVFCDHLFNSMQTVFSDYMWAVFIVFTVLAPLLAWVLDRREA